jgi:hypothetical protein
MLHAEGAFIGMSWRDGVFARRELLRVEPCSVAGARPVESLGASQNCGVCCGQRPGQGDRLVGKPLWHGKETSMTKLAITTLAATGIAAATLALAAPAAPSSGESAQDTIAQLQSEGYTVKIDRVGSGPLSACKVTDVRNPQTFTRTNRSGTASGNRGDLETIIVSKTISVSLNCTGAAAP